ncbi:MAG: hypothetical protein V9E95_16505, partial [Methanothrix soehngenii]
PAGRTMRALAEEFRLPVRRLALIELSGWAFLLGPVGIDEGETAQDRLDLLLGGSKLLQNMGVLPRAAVLSGGRGRTGEGANEWTGAFWRATRSPPALSRRELMQSIREF